MATKKLDILGVKVNPWQHQELHEQIHKYICENEKALVLNVNVNCLNLAHKYTWLREFLNSAEVVFCDGAGVILGARILGYRIPERITYADWMWELVEFAEPKGLSFYFLGGKPGIAEKAAKRISHHFPGIHILGTHHGYFNKKKDSYENKRIIQQINHLQPNILVLGFGMPLQEYWLRENWDTLNVNIALTGGAVFDYLSGELRRAPKWMTDHGFEWLGRLIIEPKRLWKRYILGNPQFLLRILKQRLGIPLS